MSRARCATQAGMSLVELMVAMALSLILIAGIIQIFSSTKFTYRTQEDVARIQENARFALDILERHIRMADFPDTTSAMSLGQYAVDPNAITGTDGGTGNPDTITLKYFASTDACGGSASGLTSFTFSIVNSGSSRVLRCNNGAADFDLISDVQTLQIQYGIDGDTSRPPYVATRYENAPTSTDMKRVVSLQVGLLMRSSSPISDVCSATHKVLDQNISTNDCHLYKVVSTTVKVRNRLEAREIP